MTLRDGKFPTAHHDAQEGRGSAREADDPASPGKIGPRPKPTLPRDTADAVWHTRPRERTGDATAVKTAPKAVVLAPQPLATGPTACTPGLIIGRAVVWLDAAITCALLPALFVPALPMFGIMVLPSSSASHAVPQWPGKLCQGQSSRGKQGPQLRGPRMGVKQASLEADLRGPQQPNGEPPVGTGAAEGHGTRDMAMWRRGLGP